MSTYKIVRHYRAADRDSAVVKTGLTLEQAQEHCSRDETRSGDWFDGYTREG
jgi:hypothetical protein